MSLIEIIQKKYLLNKFKNLKLEKLKDPENFYLVNSEFINNIILNRDVDCDALKYYYKLCKRWDNSNIKIPYQLGKDLEDLIKDNNTNLFIHRTVSSNIDDIANEGLYTLGQTLQGTCREEVSLSKTLSPVKNMMHAVINMKSKFKDSDCGIFVNLPKNVVDEDGILIGEPNVILKTFEGGQIGIKPEYIVGASKQVRYADEIRNEFKSRDEIVEILSSSERR